MIQQRYLGPDHALALVMIGPLFYRIRFKRVAEFENTLVRPAFETDVASS